MVAINEALKTRDLVTETLPEAKPLKLDLGCGKHPREGFEGVDTLNFGQRHILNLCTRNGPPSEFAYSLNAPTPTFEGFESWPWSNESVEEVVSSHFVEHLKPDERAHFVNELHRILIPGGKALIITPHWASNRAYGDLTHQWPPVSEMWFFYLNKAWREKEAPHNCALYSCDFDFTAGYSMRQDLLTRNQEHQQFALANYKEVAQDIVATLTKPLTPR